MTVVTLQGLETALGGPIPTSGAVLVQYWAGSGPFVGVAGDAVTFPAPISVRIVDGQPVSPLDLPATGDRCCVSWTVTADSGRFVQRFTSIPALGPVAFGDLVVVDPASFAPSTDAVTAWEAAIDEVAALRDEVIESLAIGPTAGSSARLWIETNALGNPDGIRIYFQDGT